MEGALPHGYQSRAEYLQGWHSSHFGPKNSSEEPTPGPGRDGFAGMPRRCRSTSAGDNRAGWTASCRAADQGDQSFSVNRLAATRRGSGRRPAEGRGASSQFGARAEVPAWPAPRGRDHGGRRRGVRRKGLRRRDDDQDRRTGGHGDRLALPVLSKEVLAEALLAAIPISSWRPSTRSQRVQPICRRRRSRMRSSTSCSTCSPTAPSRSRSSKSTAMWPTNLP